MGLNSVFREIYALNMLKKKGYSLVEIEGNDGEVRVYTMRLEGKKSIEIHGNVYILNPKKRKIKGGMTLYRFREGFSIPEDDDGNYTMTPADAKLLNEVVSIARSIGQNNSQTDKKQQLIMAGLGFAIGALIGFSIAGAF